MNCFFSSSSTNYNTVKFSYTIQMSQPNLQSLHYLFCRASNQAAVRQSPVCLSQTPPENCIVVYFKAHAHLKQLSYLVQMKTMCLLSTTSKPVDLFTIYRLAKIDVRFAQNNFFPHQGPCPNFITLATKLQSFDRFTECDRKKVQQATDNQDSS
jgi:hypothetical protein